jgi:hypothetical protein
MLTWALELLLLVVTAPQFDGSEIQSAVATETPTPVDFQRDIRPLLSDRCFSCHGPDDTGRDSELRLDSAAEAYKDLGGYAAIVPGDVEASELVFLINSQDRKERMPPERSGLSLTAHEIELLERWIAEGGEYTTHWSFVTPNSSVHGSFESVDAWVQAAQEANGLKPNPEADRETWLRRVSFGLIGLPPTPAELAAFMQDQSPQAHEKVVDRLLASPHFGERMAQSWLDLARYADTYGYQSDVGRRVWPYRDWVIEAYNQNLPYDEFVRWQLAGDMLPNATIEQKVATAFNRLHRQTNEGGSTPEEFRVEYVADRVQTFGTAFLGLTMECARCHDHRYDPISQKEYYEFAAYFDDIDEFGLYSHFTSATPTPAMDLPTDAQKLDLISKTAAVAELELEQKELDAQAQKLIMASYLASFEASAKFEFNDRDEAVTVESPNGRALLLDGDRGERLKEAGAWNRWDPFAIKLQLRSDRKHERAIVLHRSRAWTDAGSQGWQIVIEEGRVFFGLIHFWPGDAIAIRSTQELPINQWLELTVSYDGSSRATGLQILLNGVEMESEILRDKLKHKITGGGPGDPTLGERFRDRGFAGGAVESIQFFDLATLDPSLQKLRDARRQRDQARDAIPQLMVMEEMQQPRQAYLLKRGSYQLRDYPVMPRTLAAITKPSTASSPAAQAASMAARGNRLGLVDWLLEVDHPLTARVEVDRLWRTLFGVGLVITPENFGSQGSLPAMPGLFDFLSEEFQRSGWDRKQMLRRLALSSTFRQSSKLTAGSATADPENHFWSRGPSYPLPAEMLRDNALAGSGLMSSKIGGPSVYPYQPAGLWKEKSGSSYSPSKGADLYRRSLYTYWKRTSPPPTMMIFDSAKRDVCAARRQSTNTPLQALVLWNDPQFAEAARVLAVEMCTSKFPIELAFKRLAGRRPLQLEVKALRQLYQQELEVFRNNPDRAELVRSIGEFALPTASDPASGAPEGGHQVAIDPAEHAAWTLVCSALLSADPVTMIR